VAVGPDQIGLVAADNRTRTNHRFKFREIGASSSGLRSSFAARTVGDWNQLPAVVVEQETAAVFKNQLDRLAPVASSQAVTHHHGHWRKSYYQSGLDWWQSPEMFRYSTTASCTCALLAVHAHC